MKYHGHWFCEGKCDDVVTLPKPTDAGGPVKPMKCPGCHQMTAFWKPDQAQQIFSDRRAGDNETPEPEPPGASRGRRYRPDDHNIFEEMRRIAAAAPDHLPYGN